MSYIAQVDLENALGKNTVAAVFDDTGSGLVSTSAVAACLAYASAEVDAFLAGPYDVVLPLVNPPDVVKFAAVDFACAYASRRRPDLMRAMNEKSWTDFRDAAVAKMTLYAKAVERLPRTTAIPSNVGGTVRSGDPLNPVPPPKTFANGTGDF